MDCAYLLNPPEANRAHQYKKMAEDNTGLDTNVPLYSTHTFDHSDPHTLHCYNKLWRLDTRFQELFRNIALPQTHNYRYNKYLEHHMHHNTHLDLCKNSP